MFCWKSVWEWAPPYYQVCRELVSILVLLEIGLGACCQPSAPSPKNVSILVLLEIGLGVNLPVLHHQELIVSILVLLEIGLGVGHPCFRKRQRRVFQSLFCWKSVWEAIRHGATAFFMVVSILVLLEIGLGEGLKD